MKTARKLAMIFYESEFMCFSPQKLKMIMAVTTFTLTFLISVSTNKKCLEKYYAALKRIYKKFNMISKNNIDHFYYAVSDRHHIIKILIKKCLFEQ